jgi:hypothetical protein
LRSNGHGYWIKVVPVSKPLDEFEWRFVRPPVIGQILFVEARIYYRYAINLIQAPINRFAPIAI